MKKRKIEKDYSCQDKKKRYLTESLLSNDLYISDYSKLDNQDLIDMDLQCPNDGIPVFKEDLDSTNLRDKFIQIDNKHSCIEQQYKLNESIDHNLCNDSLKMSHKENAIDHEKESFGVSLNLKDKLYEDFLIRKQDIEVGIYIPKFEDFQMLTKYDNLTKKYFNHVRNEWFREILHKNNFIEYRNEIISKRFFQDDKELFNLIKSNQYPEGVLIYNLIKHLNLSFPKLEKAIYGTNYNNIIRVLQKHGAFKWEGLTSKIKKLILSVKNVSLKEQAIKEFQKYLRTKVYNGFKRKDFPKIENFKLKNYPEGWLILKLCEINLISDTKLGKLIDYSDLPYHLTELRSFKGNRIDSIKNFLSNINDKEKKEKSFRILSNYIEFVVFSLLNREGVRETDEFLDINPKKWLYIKLCEICLVPLRDLGRLIGYEEISKVINRKYDFSDTIVDRIHNFISNIINQDQKEQADKVLSQYLKRSIYNKFKTIDYPEFVNFKSKINPALWLIIQMCSIYQIRVNQLGNFIESNELFKRLRDISYFTNKTIAKFRRFIIKYGTSKQKSKARSAIDRFLQVRDSSFLRYFAPQIANIDKISKFPDLLNHLKLVNKLGNFPDEILENYHEYPRISSFNKQFRHIEPLYKKKFINKMISNEIIKVIDAKNCEKYRNIYNLIEFSKNKYYNLSQIYSSHDSPGHEYVLPKILIENQNSVGIEIPVWMRYEDLFLTGHIDLIQAIDGIIYVADYKPEETPFITKRISYSFMRSLPQVASYALLLKRVKRIETLLCITFNKTGAWIYEPEISLKLYNSFVKKFKKYKVHDRPWEKYFL